MKFDLTVTISVILALSAILSPVIVAFINNKHTLKIKRIESYDIAKRASLEQFSKACGELFANYVLSNEINMVKALYGLVPYYNTDFSVIKDNLSS